MFLTSDQLTLSTGMRFGLMQMKIGLCRILSRFEVAPCKDTPERLVFDPKSFVLLMKGELPLSFTVLK
jgi:cytochrome P450 family 6